MTNTIYVLESINMTGLGGPMGTETTSVNWTSHHKSFEGAKAKAQSDYKEGPLKWINKHGDYWTTGDLRYVMYEIRRTKALP